MFVKALMIAVTTFVIVGIVMFAKTTFDAANQSMNCNVFKTQTTNCQIR